MTELNMAQRVALGHDHQVWTAGLRAGRESMYLCETLDEAEGRSPYLIEGEDPMDQLLERIAEIDREMA